MCMRRVLGNNQITTLSAGMFRNLTSLDTL
jgi:hypothetical protein